MDDKGIISLYFKRDQQAIAETKDKYGRLLFSVAYNILYSEGDSEECVDDTYMKAWQVIPPTVPAILSAFLSKITRNIALNRYRDGKRRGRNLTAELILDEIAEAVPDTGGDIAGDLALRDSLNRFLDSLERRQRVVFLKRYFYMCPTKDIARDMGMTQSAVKTSLSRTRAKLREHLEREGIRL